jgi:hypothetical protein
MYVDSHNGSELPCDYIIPICRITVASCSSGGSFFSYTRAKAGIHQVDRDPRREA